MEGAFCVIIVRRHTVLWSGQHRSETCHTMSCLDGFRAAELLACIRGHWVFDAIYCEDHNQTRDRTSAANHSILRRMALKGHNHVPVTGKHCNSLPKRETSTALDSAYLEQLLSVL